LEGTVIWNTENGNGKGETWKGEGNIHKNKGGEERVAPFRGQILSRKSGSRTSPTHSKKELGCRGKNKTLRRREKKNLIRVTRRNLYKTFSGRHLKKMGKDGCWKTTKGTIREMKNMGEEEKNIYERKDDKTLSKERNF